MARRVNREGTYKKRSDGRVEGQVEFVDASGHRSRRSVYAKTVTDARRKIKELIAKADHGIETSAKPQTMAEYLMSWSKSDDDSKGKPLKSSTKLSRDLNARRAIPIIGSVQLAKLTSAHIRKVDNQLIAGGVSGSSRNQCFDCLETAMNQAVIDRLIVASPFALIRWVPPVPQEEMRFLTALEQAKLYLLNDEWTPVWQFLISTGLRSGECFALSWSQVDFEGGRISVTHTIQPKPGGWELTSPKTDHSRRTVQIDAEVVRILRMVKARQDAEADRLGGLWENPNKFVFTRDAGQPVLPSIAYHCFLKALDEADVKRCRVHDLRHTFAANHLNGGTPTLAVSRMMGHSSVAFTLQVYGHITTEVQDAAASLSGRLLKEAKHLGETLRTVEVA